MATRDDSKLYDVRTLERNLRKGLISKKEYEKYLKALPDREANAAISKPDESKEIEYPVEEPAPVPPSPEIDGDLDGDLV